jgi:hypothetical protein
MRVVHAAALTAAAMLLASYASAQGLGDAAARERAKRKTAPPAKPAKVYTESDVGRSMAPVSSEPAPAAEGDEAAATDEQGGAEGQPAAEGEGGAAAAPSAAEQKAEEQRQQAQAAWQKRLDQAHKEEGVYKDVIDKLQLELNDTSGGFYNPGRAAKIAFLDENKQKLAEVQGRIAALEEEGRRNSYQ